MQDDYHGTGNTCWLKGLILVSVFLKEGKTVNWFLHQTHTEGQSRDLQYSYLAIFSITILVIVFPILFFSLVNIFQTLFIVFVVVIVTITFLILHVRYLRIIQT